jgi:hypothetical protein
MVGKRKNRRGAAEDAWRKWSVIETFLPKADGNTLKGYWTAAGHC